MFHVRFLAASLLVLAMLGGPAAGVSAAPQESISFKRYAGSTLTTGDVQQEGTDQSSSGALVLASDGLASGFYSDPFGSASIPYESGSWISPRYRPGFGFGELVASWNATTPPGTWLQVQMQATTNQDHVTKWYTMGIWASDTDTIHRTSVGGQGDADGTVAIDTFFAKDHLMVSYRLKVTLCRRAGSTASPSLRAIGAVASDVKPFVPSPAGGAVTLRRAVPQLSQEVHAGEYPEFDGGGEAWCSPTSTEMVVRYWKTGPTPAQISQMPVSTVAGARPPTVDPEVDYAAMHTYDSHYKGTGNWPFNTAYAASFGLDAEVTQLHSLTEAERFIRAGIPLVASIAFGPNELPGFLFTQSDGHLLVIIGFTSTGDVIVNDPAATTDQGVRKVYDRKAFERAWLNGSGGIVYIIHPASVPLPPVPAGQLRNW
jgi:hypothetical protein